jgi:hypothetical protein
VISRKFLCPHGPYFQRPIQVFDARDKPTSYKPKSILI